MNIVSRSLKRFTMRFQRQAAYLSLMPRASYDVVREVGNGYGSSVVMAPLLWAMRTFPEAPIMVEELQSDGTEEEVVGHPLTDLLHRPNPHFSGELMWWATIGSLLTTGNAVWVKVRDAQLRVIEYWWVPWELIKPKWPNDGSIFISHYEYRPGGTPIRVENEDIIHLRYGVDPENPRLGLSPLASALREVFSDDEAAAFTGELLRNMGVPGLIISPDGDAVVADEDLEAAKAKIESEFGRGRRGKPFVAGAPTKVQQFGFSPKDLDLKVLRRLPEERVSAVLGIPAIVAGLGAGLDRSTFANMSEAREMAYESTIIPLQRLISSDLANQTMADFEPDPSKYIITFDLTKVRVLQEDDNKKTDRLLNELRAGAITLAEYRAETGREVDDKKHDVFYLPFNVVITPSEGLGVPPPSSSAEPPPDPNAEPELDDDGEPIPVSTDPNDPKTKGRKATAVQQEYVKQIREREAVLAGGFESELIDVFLELGDACSAALGGKGREWPETKDVNDDAADRLLVDSIMAAADVGSFNEAKLKPLFEAHYARVTADTLATINRVTDLNLNLPDHVARRVVAQGGTRAGLVDVSNSTRNAIFRALRESRELGEGPQQAARRIRDHVPAGRFTNAGPQYRSQLIARTETKFAQNVSALEAYGETDTVRGVLAFDAQGGTSDPDCISRDGTIFTLSEASTELAREHPNGTLSFAPVI